MFTQLHVQGQQVIQTPTSYAVIWLVRMLQPWTSDMYTITHNMHTHSFTHPSHCNAILNCYERLLKSSYAQQNTKVIKKTGKHT